MPTLAESAVILLLLVLIFTAGRLDRMGNALARLIHGPGTPPPEPAEPAEPADPADADNGTSREEP